MNTTRFRNNMPSLDYASRNAGIPAGSGAIVLPDSRLAQIESAGNAGWKTGVTLK
jgi:hypothetical protein